MILNKSNVFKIIFLLFITFSFFLGYFLKENSAGGGTEFYGMWKDNKNEPGATQLCEARPGRLVKFGWDEMHAGTNWNSKKHKRVILSAYLNKDCPQRIIDKIHFYIWGSRNNGKS